uniref:FBA_2 domain-containing protein n=1 Tax=Caenorhabditis tropicalis TaxID=1561998 RepID=A0A1I7TRH8_9PELO
MKSLSLKKKKKDGPFHLLQLPLVTLEIIFEEMRSIDLLNLSACSTACARKIGFILKRHSANTIIVYLCNPRPSITIKFQHPGHDLKWIFERNEKPSRRHVLDNKSFSGHLFTTYHTRSNPFEVMCSNEDVLECFPLVLKHLQDLFTVPVEIVVEPHLDDSLIGLFQNPLFTVCNALELTRGYHYKFFRNDEVQKICDNIIIEKTLIIGATIDHFSMRNQIFSVQNVCLENADWMNLDDLLRLDCKVARMGNHQFDEEDIEAFAMKWMNESGKPKLQRMEFGWMPDTDFGLANIKTMNWDKNLRSRHCLRNVETMEEGTVDCGHISDIIRKDGLMASIGIVESRGMTFLIFHVWHDRFPTKPHEDILAKTLADFYEQQPEMNRVNGIGGIAEGTLSNPDLAWQEFQDVLQDTYTHRFALFGESVELDLWLDFHTRMLNVKKEIASFE